MCGPSCGTHAERPSIGRIAVLKEPSLRIQRYVALVAALVRPDRSRMGRVYSVELLWRRVFTGLLVRVRW